MGFNYNGRNNKKGFNKRNGSYNAGQQQQSTRKATTSEAVDNRDFVVICADKSGRVATFAENTNYVENYSEYYNDTKLGMFEQLRDVLDNIPTNAEEILEKPVAIYVPGAICFHNSKDNKTLCDMYRNDKYSTCKDIMIEVSNMLQDRALNCFIVDITGSGATIVRSAYDYVKEESKKANAQASGKEYVAPTKPTATVSNNAIADKIAQLEMQIADAIIEGDDNKVARIESAIARLKGVSAPAVKEEQPEDELANVEL